MFSRVSSGEEETRKQDYGVSPITPRSAAQLRLRFLSRVGQQVSGVYRKSLFICCWFFFLLFGGHEFGNF